MKRKDFKGRVVRFVDDLPHAQHAHLAGGIGLVEGYWDEITGGSWMNAEGNPAALIYAIRMGIAEYRDKYNIPPFTDEVLYIHDIFGLGSIIHVNEISKIIGEEKDWKEMVETEKERLINER
ncbi:MAG: hypothetical protein SVK08_00150 [Halobacteriota archaeon]|nr:hypothetical protein [Halobacteriota archaeon]